MSSRHWNRRSALQAMGAGVVGTWSASSANSAEAADKEPYKPKDNIKQSVCRWCYGDVKLDKLAAEAAKMGYKSIELLGIDDYKTVKELGLTCAMMRCASIPDGLNRKENHEKIEKELRTHIDFAAAEGLPNVICMSGNRKGLADDEGLKVCAEGLKRVLGYA
jgi:hydroxypyruvate isomerase